MRKAPGTSDGDSYGDLLARLQPRSIQSAANANAIQRQIDTLIDREELSSDEREVLSLLGDLMLAWESDEYELPEVSPAETIQALLEAHGMRQSDLVGSVFPTRSIASEVLNGKRRLTYDHVAKLARHFHVSPAIFYSMQEIEVAQGK